MPPIDAAPTVADRGHSNHVGNTGSVSGGNSPTSFAATLSQAIGQLADGNAAHTSHGTVASIPGGSTHLILRPASGTDHGAGQGLQSIAMGIRIYRMQLIASNIANADTPGYKAVDIDFQEAVRIATTTQTSSISVLTTAAGHFSGQAFASMPNYPLRYQIPSQPSVDGNTVDMDVERSKLAENTLMYQFSMDRVSGHFKMMMELFQSMKP